MSELSCTFYSKSAYRSTCHLVNFPDDTRAFIFAGKTIDDMRTGVNNFIKNVISLNTALNSINSHTTFSTYSYEEVTGPTLTFTGGFYGVVICSLAGDLTTSTCNYGESVHQLLLKGTNNKGVNVYPVVTTYDPSLPSVQRFDNRVCDINIVFSVMVPQLTLTFNLNNCTVDPQTTSYLFPISQVLTITPTQKYVFENIPTITIDNNTYNFTVSDNIATFDLSVLDYNRQVTGIVTSNCYEYITANITVNSSNCNVSYDPPIFEKNKTLLITVSAAEDTFYFPIAPSVYLNCYNLSTETLTMNKVDDYTYTITLSGEWVDVHGGFFVEITANASFNTDLAKKYGLITIYKPNRDILINLSRLRIYSYSASQRVLVDLGQFITSMKAIYINADIVGESDIILGNTDTNIPCPLINDDLININLGSVTINGRYNNNIDVLHSQIVATLPFIGVVNLDSDVYINKTVKIVYKVNLITAKCIADIYISYENEWILKDSFSGVIGMNIPYILQDNSFDYMQFKQTEVNNDLFIAIPQINVFENTKVNENETVFNTDKEVLIGDLPANTNISINEIVETHNVSVINRNDYDMIIQILKEGVII